MKTIETLENDFWGEPPAESTELIKRCYALRKKPIDLLSVEDLRVLIGQNIGLKYIIPVAINKLEDNILIEGNLYPGDLLYFIFKSDKNYWQENVNKANRLINLFLLNESNVLNSDEINEEIKSKIQKAFSNYKNQLIT